MFNLEDPMESVELLRSLTQSVWKFICDCVRTCVKAVLNSIDHTLSGIKAFYDSIPEKLKEDMVRTKKIIDKICGRVSQLASDTKGFCKAAAAKLVSYLVKVTQYVKSFFGFVGVVAEKIKKCLKYCYNKIGIVGVIGKILCVKMVLKSLSDNEPIVAGKIVKFMTEVTCLFDLEGMNAIFKLLYGIVIWIN